MSAQCMRPGCAGVAAVRLVFDAVGCEVWLDELGDAPAPGSTQAQVLCAYHGSRLGVPRGWTVVDRRSPLVAAEAARPEPSRSEPVAPEPVPAEPVPAEPVRADPVAAEPVPPVDPTPPAVTMPDPPEAEPASGSLLGRAFAWAGPQRSAITQRPGPDADADADDAAGPDA